MSGKQEILVIGSSGLVGSRFVELSRFKKILRTPTSSELNITKPIGIKEDIVINFAAYTNISEAEDQRGNKKGECWRVNVDGVGNILKACKNSKSRFIQISTDYVFAGLKNDPSHTEDCRASEDESQLTWYGFTKALAERIILNHLGPKATILRLVYPVRSQFDRKLDYLRKPLKLYDEGKLYPMFTDQQVSISFIDEITLALDKIIEKNIAGIFHASSRNLSTPYDLVSYLLERARGVTNVVQPATLREFLKKVSNPVRYPQYGGLKVDETEKRLGLKFSACKEIIHKLVNQGIEV